MTAQPPAGWYPDSLDARQVRYWDGQQWTSHTAPLPPAAAGTDAAASVEAHDTEVPAVVVASTRSDHRQPVKLPTLGARKEALRLIGERDERIAGLENALARLHGLELADVEQEISRRHGELAAMQQQIAQGEQELSSLRSQVLDVRQALDLEEFGLFDFEHPAESSAELANRLSSVRLEIKRVIKEGRAVSATENFTFNQSAAQGRKFVKAMSKTMLAAYNAEVENCIKTVRAGNLPTARARLDRVVTQISRNGEMIDLHVTPEYHHLRLTELSLAARHLEVLKAEKEAERERRAELREQQKAEAELRRERERLQKERAHYLNTLAALRARGDDATVADLELKLADVDRAIADVDYRAANIRAGFVYVISNIGSFGERMVKIGMTRRLEPYDRVKELGDASVPFGYDVHALFFADDAVGVEAMLHREFADRRVNRINTRREFFYCTPDEVLAALRHQGVAVVEFTTHAAAEEYRLSVAAATHDAPPIPGGAVKIHHTEESAP